jgi:uncharacterized protein
VSALAALRESTESELDAFERIGLQLAGFDDRLQPEWIDGYLTGLLAGPLALRPEQWMPPAFGDAFERAFADPVAAADAQAALTARWKVIASQLDPQRLLDEPEQLFLAPLVWVPNSDESVPHTEAAPPTASTWAHGALAALGDFADAFGYAGLDAAARADHDDILSLLNILVTQPGDALTASRIAAAYPDEAPTREQLLDDAAFALQDLRVFWLDHGPKPATRKAEPTPGRNDACPCGSGLKYKKCHGAATAV